MDAMADTLPLECGPYARYPVQLEVSDSAAADGLPADALVGGVVEAADRGRGVDAATGDLDVE